MRDRPSKPAVLVSDFDQRLKLAELTKTRFADLVGIQRTTVMRWKRLGVPAWTVSWLMLYRRASQATRKRIDDWADFKPPK